MEQNQSGEQNIAGNLWEDAWHVPNGARPRK